MVAALAVLSGLAWTLVYIDCVRVGFRDQTYAIPVAALALNIAWESIYAVRGLVTTLSLQTFVNAAWALADVLVIVTYVRFGRREFPLIPPAMFAVGSLGLLALASVVQGLFIAEFGWDVAPAYSAFLQNVLMSALFIAMLLARRDDRGQSMFIATSKWLGTLAPTVAFGIIQPHPFILGLGALCTCLDLAYIGLLGWVRAGPQGLRAASTQTARRPLQTASSTATTP